MQGQKRRVRITDLQSRLVALAAFKAACYRQSLGSPFPNVKWTVKGKEINFLECKNALIYPGIGFRAIIAQSRCVTDTMLIAGARLLASLSPATNGLDGEYTGASLLPDFADSPNVNFKVAVAVAEQVVQEGSAGERWLKAEPGWTLKFERCSE